MTNEELQKNAQRLLFYYIVANSFHVAVFLMSPEKGFIQEFF